MRGRILVVVGMAVVLAAGLVFTAHAQESEAVTVTFEGEVLKVEEGALVLKMQPDGEVRTSTPVEGRKVIVDGEEIPWEELEVGTVLSATVNFIPDPDMYEEVSGKMIHRVNQTVIMKLETGEVKQFTVDNDFRFYAKGMGYVDGKAYPIQDLRPGIKVTATRVKADPAMVISPATPIMGKAPKN